MYAELVLICEYKRVDQIRVSGRASVRLRRAPSFLLVQDVMRFKPTTAVGIADFSFSRAPTHTHTHSLSLRRLLFTPSGRKGRHGTDLTSHLRGQDVAHSLTRAHAGADYFVKYGLLPPCCCIPVALGSTRK